MKVKELLKKVGDKEITKEQEQKIYELLGVRSKVWKPVENDVAYQLTSDGYISTCTYNEYYIDSYTQGNLFRTSEEAEFEAGKRKVETELKRFAEEHNDEIEWSNDGFKYDIWCCHRDGTLSADSSVVWQGQGAIHFSSRELCEKAIKQVGEDRIEKYLFGIK